MKAIKNIIIAVFMTIPVLSGAQVHTTYLWHMQQPIYWPEISQWDQNRYQMAWESHWQKFNGGNIYSDGIAHPLNDLQEIFSKPDRVAAYQYGPKNAVQSLNNHPEGGAQVNYGGCLVENVNSLADAGQWGYYQGWQNDFQTARSWTTSGGNPRMDMTAFTFHHVLAPLVSEEVLRKEIQAHKIIYGDNFGSGYSKGFWPAECAFSERIIKVLAEEGIEWSVIANSHLARTLCDYPLNYGTSGCNIDPPNAADVVSTEGANWWSGQLDGRGGTFAAPYCYQAHKAQYVDPTSGQEYVIDVVPMCDLLSYQNGFATMGTGDIDAHIAPYDDPNQPSIVLMAHDGDNAWGGGSDYYNNSVPGFANAAASQGYVPTTIQQFLDDHPVPSDDLVHVEDGAWVNAANDWGHPQFINWLWPMYDASYNFDPNGWTEDARNWAVLTAAENYTQMAEDLSGGVNMNKVVYPDATSTAAEKAWHFLLPGFTSGYMYYGTSLDMEVKQSLAGNIAIDFAEDVIATNPGVDQTAPSVFIPQRYPYNPGAEGFGPTYGYQTHANSSDVTIWTFAYDVNGLSDVSLKFRIDDDGLNPLADNANETYAGGPGVASWQSATMNQRIFPTGNITGNGDIDFFILPDAIADEYYYTITGLDEVLIDYYVEATDANGNITKSAIQHVYIGNNAPCSALVGEGCTDAAALNFDPEATIPDGSCEYNVTFSVDMSLETVAPEGVHIAGSFQGWNPSGSPMTDEGNGIWSITLPVQEGEQLYKFINGSDWPQEESVPEACGISNGFGAFDRSISVSGDATIPTVCYSGCDACSGELGCTYANAENYNALATIDDGSCIWGSSFCGPNSVWDPITSQCIGSTACVGDLNGDSLINSGDLVALLAGFGDTCE